ncbi:MAG: DUF4010 domain-containing protein [Gammaproteobacteria bacterium]|nr:DUF4010 domain-containing protein [Gammaproteobacteria bacterium]
MSVLPVSSQSCLPLHDVDAISLSIVNMVLIADVVSIETAGKGILIAAIINRMVKAEMALFIDQMQSGLWVGLTLLLLLVLGSGLFFYNNAISSKSYLNIPVYYTI